jgi:hypothetical protein
MVVQVRATGTDRQVCNSDADADADDSIDRSATTCGTLWRSSSSRRRRWLLIGMLMRGTV